VALGWISYTELYTTFNLFDSVLVVLEGACLCAAEKDDENDQDGANDNDDRDDDISDLPQSAAVEDRTWTPNCFR